MGLRWSERLWVHWSLAVLNWLLAVQIKVSEGCTFFLSISLTIQWLFKNMPHPCQPCYCAACNGALIAPCTWQLHASRLPLTSIPSFSAWSQQFGVAFTYEPSNSFPNSDNNHSFGYSQHDVEYSLLRGYTQPAAQPPCLLLTYVTVKTILLLTYIAVKNYISTDIFCCKNYISTNICYCKNYTFTYIYCCEKLYLYSHILL